VRVTGTARRAWSTFADFDYTRVTMMAGLVCTLGVL